MIRTRSFAHDRNSVTEARHFVAELVSDYPSALAEAAVLLTSELATNAIRHAGQAFSVRVETTAEQLRVEVTDAGEGQPMPRSPQTLESSGRGLQIVESLSDEWGVARVGPGKTVWFSLHVSHVGYQSRDGAATFDS